MRLSPEYIQPRQVVLLFRKKGSDGSEVYHIPPGRWLIKLYVAVTVSGSSPTAKPESAATVRRGTLARIDGQLQERRCCEHLQAVCKEQFQPQRALLRLSYHWTETRQQLTQWDSEGPNYCPYHLHNYNVFLRQGQYRNCKLQWTCCLSLVEVIFEWREPVLLARQPGSQAQARGPNQPASQTAHSIGFKKPTVWRNESFAPQIIWNYSAGCIWGEPVASTKAHRKQLFLCVLLTQPSNLILLFGGVLLH